MKHKPMFPLWLDLLILAALAGLMFGQMTTNDKGQLVTKGGCVVDAVDACMPLLSPKGNRPAPYAFTGIGDPGHIKGSINGDVYIDTKGGKFWQFHDKWLKLGCAISIPESFGYINDECRPVEGPMLLGTKVIPWSEWRILYQ